MSGGDGDISYTLDADVSGVIAGLEETQTAANEAMASVTESAELAGTALDVELGEGAKKAQEHMEELHEEATSVAEALEELKGKLNTVFEASGAAAAYEAYEKVSESFEHAAESAEHLITQSKELGLTFEQTEALGTAANEASVKTQAFERTFLRLNVAFIEAQEGSKSATDKLDKLGISTDAVTDKQHPLAEMYAIIHERLEKNATSEKEAAAIREQFGIKSASTAELLEKFSLSAAAVAAQNEKVGAASKEAAEQAAKLGVEMKVLGETTSNYMVKTAAVAEQLVHSTVAQWALLGPLSMLILKHNELASSMTNVQHASGQIVRATDQERIAEEASARDVLKTRLESDSAALASARSGSLVKVELAGQVAEETAELYKRIDGTMADVTKKAYEEAAKAVQEYSEKQLANSKTVATAVAESQEKVAVSYQNTALKILASENETHAISPQVYAEAQIAADTAIEQSEIRMYQAKKAALVDDGQNNAENAAQRLSLNASIEAAREQLTDKTIEIRSKETQALNKQEQDEEKIRMDGAKQTETVAIDQANMMAKAAAADAQGDSSGSAAIVNARKQIDAAAAVLTAQQSFDAQQQASYDKLHNDKVINDEQYATLSAALMNDETIQAEKAALTIQQANMKAAQTVGQEWKQAMTPIATGFASTFDGMLKHTETFQQGMRKIGDSILQEWEKSMITVPLEQWAQRMGREVALAQISATAKTSIDKTSQEEGMLMSAENALKERANAAANAAANAYKSAAAIPYIGWLLGPIEAAAAFAAVMAFPIASAAGGMMVDEDQMAMVHENEMILPQDIRQGIEQKILNPTTDQSSTGSGNANHFSISAMDSKSFEKFLSTQKNRNSVANMVNKANQRGNRNVRTRV